MLLKPLVIGNIKLENNIFLAPMAGITDLPFRLLCKKEGCGLVYSEMISAKGFMYGNENTVSMLSVHPDERPVSLQIFGSQPGIIAAMIRTLDCNTDISIYDINMGCPMHKIVKNGEGSALMKDAELVAEIVYAASHATKKPVTVKIRKGFDSDSINAVQIAITAQNHGAAAIAVHGRTRAEYYSGHADWDIIKQVKEAVRIPVIGNGDVNSAAAAKKMLFETGCDAVMIGRAAQGNPWIFKEIIHYLGTGELCAPPDIDTKIAMASAHLDMLINYKGERIAVREMRKHLAWYTKGIPDSAKFRTELNSALNRADIVKLLSKLRNCSIIT